MATNNIPMMKIRPHRGSLEESMSVMETIPSTPEAVRGYMQRITLGISFTQEELDSVQVVTYDTRPDDRIGWDRTLVVRYRMRGSHQMVTWGMCDQPLSD